jgi:type I restriction enzyme S subunit
MSSDQLVGRFSIGDLIKLGAIRAHKDGNFGSLYPKIEDFVEDGFPLLTAKVVNDGRIDFYAAQKLSKEKAALLKYGFIQPKDVLLSHNATVGRVAVVPDFRGSALIGTSLTYFRLDESKLLPRYLAAFFEGRDFQNQLSAVMGLSTRNQVPITAQRLLEIEVPSLNEQHKISSFVSSIDDRITLLRETNTTLEAIAQALFKSWFVDFDPVHAKMQGLTPEGMDEATAALFPDSFEQSELGAVPKGWSIKAMADVSTVGIGKTPPRKEQHWFSESQSDVRWVSIRDMGSVGVYAAETSEFLTTDAVEKFNVRRVPDNTVLMSFKMTIGRVAITDGEMTTNEAIAHFKLEPGAPISSEFIYLHLKQFDFSKLSSTSSIADAVNSKTVREIPILLPSFEVLRAFQDQVGVLFSALKNREQHAQSIAQMRDVLLPRLISGQLRLNEALESLQ